MTDGPSSYGAFTDSDGEPRIRRVPISYVAALPGSGDFPGHIFWLKSGLIGLYVWDGSTFVGPLGTGGGGGAPATAQYVVMALDGGLTSERVLTAGAAISITDGGAGGLVTILVPNLGITTPKLADDAATYAKMQNVSAASRLLGRGSAAGAGDPEEIVLGTNLSMSGTTLNATGGGGSVPTGTGFRHVTAGVEDAAAKLVDTADINDDQVTDAKLRESAALSVIGRSANTVGNPADIVASADGDVLRRSGTAVGFGQIATAGITDAAVTLAKLADMTTDRLLGRDAAGTGAVQELTVGGGLGFTSTNGIRIVPNSEHAVLCTLVGGGSTTWRAPALYPSVAVFKQSSANLQFQPLSMTGSFTDAGGLFTGLQAWRSDHKVLYVYDSGAAGWLSVDTFELYFGLNADSGAAPVYLKFNELIGFATFTDTLGHIIGAPVKVVGLSLVMDAVPPATTTIEVFDDGAAVSGASLTLSTSESRKADEALISATIAANSVIGVKVTAGTVQGPCRGIIRLRRFET